VKSYLFNIIVACDFSWILFLKETKVVLWEIYGAKYKSCLDNAVHYVGFKFNVENFLNMHHDFFLT
jgi:hypothetical protein